LPFLLVSVQSPTLAARSVFFVATIPPSSIIAQALLNRSEGQGFRALSAGSQPAVEVHPVAKALLKANGIWSQALEPKDCGGFIGQDAPPVDFVISLGAQPPDGMPSSWPWNPRGAHRIKGTRSRRSGVC
jgi:hypothetical protein